MMDSSSPRVSLVALLDEVRRAVAMEDIRVCSPASVLKVIPAHDGEYGPLPLMVEVELDHNYARKAFEGDAEEDETFNPRPGSLTGEGELVAKYPAFTCPVFFPGPSTMWPRGELPEGEQGLVVWTDRALGRWLVAAREGGATVDPGYSWTHGNNPSDSFFVPGLFSGPRWPDDVPSEGGKIGPSSGLSGLAMTDAGVLLDSDEDIRILSAKEVLIEGNAVRLGGAAAVKTIALVEDFISPWTVFESAIAALPGAVYATDIAAIKAAVTALSNAMKALPGSAVGRG